MKEARTLCAGSILSRRLGDASSSAFMSQVILSYEDASQANVDVM